MNARQSIAISTLVFGFAISAAYAQDTQPNNQNNAPSTQQAGTSNKPTEASSTKIRIGETWEEHLQKEMNKEAAQQQAQGQNQGQ